eukprot:g7227.t1
MSNIIWGWATLALFHRPLFDATADLLKQRSSEGDLGEVLSEWKAQELSNTAWSFTTVLHVHPASAAMAHAALRRLDEFHARHSANLAWRLATLESSQRPLLETRRGGPTLIGQYRLGVRLNGGQAGCPVGSDGGDAVQSSSG